MNLFELLNISLSATKEEVDAAFRLSKKINPGDNQARLAWKVLRDDNYRKLYAHTLSLEAVYRAGFFDDKEDDDSKWLNEDLRFISTPYQKIIERLPGLSAGQSGAILVTTGSFSPLHQGHIDMLETAREHIEAMGEYVVGGYVIPAHDSYVATKNSGEAGMSADLRIHLAQLSLKYSDWLMVDGSEALCNPCDRNFTDIIRRLKKYISFHFKESAFKFYFVCGEDVFSFSDAFLETGECICVGRGLQDGRPALGDGSAAAPIFIENKKATKSYSSTQVRRGNHSLLSDEALELYEKWQRQFNVIREYDSRDNFYYHIRVEGVAFYQQWLKNIDPLVLADALNVFRKKLIKVLQRSFIDSIPPSSNLRIKVSPIYLESQLKKLAALELDRPTISMDQCYGGDYAIGVSRLFALSDGQLTGIKLVKRPGMPELEQQIAAIPDGEYYLVEDDIGSGQTMALLRSALPERIAIKDTILMNRFNHDHLTKEELDIVDMRDFLLGSRDGGLVTLLSSDRVSRSIYAYPYVNLIQRAKVPFVNSLKLSRDIWELNLVFFSSLKQAITIKDLYENAGGMFIQPGFDENTAVTDVCKWHLSYLDKALEYQKLHYGIELYHMYDDEGLAEEGLGSISVAADRIREITEDKKSYCVTLLIDDYRSKNYLLEKSVRDVRHKEIIAEFHEVLKQKNIHIDFFAFESMMIKNAKKIIKRLPPNLIVKDYYKKKQSYVTMLKNQGFRIGLVEIWENDLKYSCALLSAAWILCRLGEENIPSDRLVSVRGKNFAAQKIITILPKSYEASENKAKVILVSAGYEQVMDKLEHIYY